MLVESIGYTAMLVDYIAKLTNRDLADIANAIGEAGIARLAHNAPMNRHLPILRIANEVMSDYEIFCHNPDLSVLPDTSFSKQTIIHIHATTSHKTQYATCLFRFLCQTSSH